MIDANWLNDAIQFPRLLAELRATGIEQTPLISEAAVSMDLEPSDLTDLFDRAEAAWDAIVASGPDSTLRHVTEPDPDGRYVEAKLTEEGVIVDTYDPNGELSSTFARTYDEFIEGSIPNCKRCGSHLADGLCSDETCPFSDRAQTDPFTEG